jgi:hypothetical protein
MHYLHDYNWSDKNFAILFGKEFILDCILLTPYDLIICKNWVEKLKLAINFYKTSNYTFKLEKFMTTEYNQYQPKFNLYVNI